MSTQPLALLLADLLAWGTATAFHHAQAAAELRRLHAQRDALLKALKKIAAIENKMVGSDWEEIEEARCTARAAIAAVEEGK